MSFAQISLLRRPQQNQLKTGDHNKTWFFTHLQNSTFVILFMEFSPKAAWLPSDAQQGLDRPTLFITHGQYTLVICAEGVMPAW